MTTETHTDFKSYYPEIKLPNIQSEKFEKMIHDHLVCEHKCAEDIKREMVAKYSGLWHPLNPHFGITEK